MAFIRWIVSLVRGRVSIKDYIELYGEGKVTVLDLTIFYDRLEDGVYIHETGNPMEKLHISYGDTIVLVDI